MDALGRHRLPELLVLYGRRWGRGGCGVLLLEVLIGRRRIGELLAGSRLMWEATIAGCLRPRDLRLLW